VRAWTESEVELQPVSPEAAAAILDGTQPAGLNLPEDYPSEFSAGVAGSVVHEGMVGPFFILRKADGLIVGEIGGAISDDMTIEIGYAVVDSQHGCGFATGAVLEIVKLAPGLNARRIIAHTPPDRAASSRVLEKAGFVNRGLVEDEHEGELIEVSRWEFVL